MARLVVFASLMMFFWVSHSAFATSLPQFLVTANRIQPSELELLNGIWKDVCLKSDDGPIYSDNEADVSREIKFWHNYFEIYSRAEASANNLRHAKDLNQIASSMIVSGHLGSDIALLKAHDSSDKYRFYKSVQGYKSCGLTAAEFSAINLYTQSLYKIINQELLDSTFDDSAYINVIKAAFEKLTPVKASVRRISFVSDQDFLKLQVGQIFIDPTLVSTSITDQNFPGNTVTHIESNSGRFIAAFSVLPLEYEVLFAPGAKFQITKLSNHEIWLREL